MTFKDLMVKEPILKALIKKGYSAPTPIQESAIPIILQGHDILGCASTGTGKTAAFAIPIIQMISNKEEVYTPTVMDEHPKWAKKKKSQYKKIQALILTPTRELALQIDENFKDYSINTNVTSCVIFGGVSQRPQVDILRRGVDVLIATPGRLLDLMNQGFINLSSVNWLVLDEADRMLDMGFIHDVKRIIEAVPSKRQTLFFSATLANTIDSFARTVLTNPVSISIEPEKADRESIEQKLFMVERGDKKALLVDIIKHQLNESVLVFSRTKHGADKIARDLCKNGIDSEAIHGNKSQNARQRALDNFKNHSTQVLVATDVAARGIDIDNLPMVINFDLPDVPETYVHRIGRTGRAGNVGVALSFCEPQERSMVKSIQKLIGQRIQIAN